VAVVNGRKITEKEFHQRLETMGGGRTLRDMIRREILTQEAEAQGITVSPQRVDEDVARAERDVGSHDELLRFLAFRGQTLEQFRDERAFILMLEELGSKDVKVTDEDVRAYFDEYRGEFDKPEMYRVAEILVGTETEAKELRAQLNDPRASFNALARERSKSPTASMGGTLPPRPLDSFPPELQPELQGLKLAGLLGPFEMEEGWRIIKLLGKDPGQPGSLDDPTIRDAVYQRLRAGQSKNATELLDEMTRQGKYRVSIRWPRYKELQREFETAPALPEFGAPGAPQPEARPEGGERPAAKEPSAEKPERDQPQGKAGADQPRESKSTNKQASQTNQ